MVVVDLNEHKILRQVFHSELKLSDGNCWLGSLSEVFSRCFPGKYYLTYDIKPSGLIFILKFFNEREETVWVLKWL